jgi:ubiquitin-like 1-activating enzyme E1 B
MRTSVLELLYGAKVQDIRKLNILLVGVGGIGCEVLKGLAKLPIESLHILDLDTIEVFMG